MRKEFLFADSYVPLNHGSYGTYPQSVRAAMLKWSAVAEQRPDIFMRKTYMPEIVKGRELVAEAIGAETQDCVFVMNATTGVNEVLRSLEWSAGDAVLIYSTVYGISFEVLI
jgi:hercynylcysteine S-oxide lyase